MAERRMFAKTIVLSDSFLDLSLGARCLYMTMSMLADDDGFVNSPRSIMRQTGASNDDMRLLIDRKFVIPFDSGIIVIKHWRINNYLRSDRYQETKYTAEKSQLVIEENGAYKVGIPGGIPSNGIPSIGKDRLEKDRLDEGRLDDGIPTEDDIRQYCETEHLNISPSRFFSYYSQNGWKNKNGKRIVDWRQQCRVWAEQDKVKETDNRQRNGFIQNDITQADLDALLATSLV